MARYQTPYRALYRILYIIAFAHFAFAHCHFAFRILHCALPLRIIFARKTRENTVYLFLFKILPGRVGNPDQYSIPTCDPARILDTNIVTRLEYLIPKF